MPRSVSYRIHDREDGLFDAVATLAATPAAPDRTFRRTGFASLAAAEDWIDGLRAVMAAIGAPVVRAQPIPEPSGSRDDPGAPDSGTAGARLQRFRDAVSDSEG